MITFYGIKNCDTIKKARRAIEQRGIDYQFHDYRLQGLTPELLNSFIDALGWEVLLNKRGTTWRQLDPARQATITDRDRAVDLLLEYPAMIKRPLLVTPGKPILLGFDETSYQRYLSEV